MPNQAPKFYKSVPDAIAGYRGAVSERISTRVRQLLETKHLYQSVTVDSVREEFLRLVEVKVREHSSMNMPEVAPLPWILHSIDMKTMLGMANNKEPHFEWKAPDAKLYCKRCARTEPFNYRSGSALLNAEYIASGGVFNDGKLEQVFALTYLCQSCKAIPETFLVRRLGAKLMLTGRSPMEHVAVPATIPKEVSEFFSGSLIAHNSGQTLAAVFLLRTMCEQWARRFADKNDKADVAMDKYMATLPDDFKARFPSLREIYADLSAAIHSAEAPSLLFDESSAKVSRHFAARALFELPSSATT